MTSEQAKQLGDDAVKQFAEAIEARQSDALKAYLDLNGHPPVSECNGSERGATSRALIPSGYRSQPTKHWTGSRFALRLELKPNRSRNLQQFPGSDRGARRRHEIHPGSQAPAKDTGRKLAHVEKQMRTGHSISTELTRRLKEHSL